MQSKQARNMKAKTTDLFSGGKIMHKGSPVQDLNNYKVRMFGVAKGFRG